MGRERRSSSRRLGDAGRETTSSSASPFCRANHPGSLHQQLTPALPQGLWSTRALRHF